MNEKTLIDRITLKKIINQISPFRKKLIFQMYYLDNFSFKRIANCMKMNELEVKKMIESTVLSLKERYGKSKFFEEKKEIRRQKTTR